jgi:sugar lactone lactonase YvrE
MTKLDTRSYFASIVRSARLHWNSGVASRKWAQLGMLLLVVCGYGQASATAQVQPAPVIAVVAGNGTQGFSGNHGPATSAELGTPQGVAVDSENNLYIADDIAVWKVTAGTITVVAGNGTAGLSGVNGPATSAQLGDAVGVAADSAGNLYIADLANSLIWKVSAGTGTITIAAGSTMATGDGQLQGMVGYSGDGGPATNAELNNPQGVAVDSAGNLYIADSNNQVIRFVSAATGTITTIAGNGTQGYSGDGGVATGAELSAPAGVAVDSAGNLYIADTSNNVIRQVSAATGTIATVAGTANGAGYSGDGGPATSAELANPQGVAVDSADNIFIADTYNVVIRVVSASTGTITTVAGNGTQGFSGSGGLATNAELVNPTGVAVNTSGDFYIADTYNSVTWEVFATIPPFPITAVASTGTPQNVFLQLNAAQAITSITAAPSQGGKQEYVVGTITGCTVDSATSNPAATICTVPITFQPAYPGNRGVSLQVVTSTGAFSFGLNGIGTGPQVALIPGTIITAAGNGTQGFSGSGGAAASAELSLPTGAAVDSAGDIFIADALNNLVWEVSAATGAITTVAGNGTAGYSGDNGPAASAELNTPSGVAVDSAGNLYIADVSNNVIRKVSPSTGTITTVAGNGTAGYSGDGGAANSAELNNPQGVAVDSAGNLYIADSSNNVVRFVAVSTGSTAGSGNNLIRILPPAPTGTITTIAGNGTSGYSGDGGVATSAELNSPLSVAVDSAGNFYIADTTNNVIRAVSSGVITTVVGNGTGGYSGDGGAATSAELNNPDSVALDSAGHLYIADTLNNRIRMVSSAVGTIITAAGNGSIGYSGNGAAATSAELHTPISIALDSIGNLYIADALNFVVREVEVTMPPAITFLTATPEGSTDTTDGPQTAMVSNIGNTALTFPAPPSLAASFTLDNASTCPSGSTATLSSGASCILAVDFAPVAAGAISGSLILTDNALNAAAPNLATQSIALNGVGISTAPIVPVLTFTPIPAQVVGAAQFAVSATSASSGAVTYAVMSGPATIAGNLVTVTGAGTVVLVANQAASGTYAAATATISFTVSLPTVPTLVFAPIPTQIVGAAPFAVSAVSASSGAVTYAVTSGPATIAGNLVTVTGAGTVMLTANQVASGTYAAGTATASFSVVPPFTLAASTSSASVAPGSVASFTLTVTPVVGTTLSDAISFTATGLPPGATATFSPSTLVASGDTSTTVGLSIQTVSSLTAHNERPITGNPLAPVALGLLLLPLLGMKAARRRLQEMSRLPLVLLAVGLSLAAVLSISGCGGSSAASSTPTPPTPAAQTYTVVVTATDTTTKAQSLTNLTLTVQ